MVTVARCVELNFKLKHKKPFHAQCLPSLEECIAEVLASADENCRRHAWKRDGYALTFERVFALLNKLKNAREYFSSFKS